MAKKQKEMKYKSDDQKEVIRFIAILVSIIVVVGLVYFLSNVFMEDTSTSEIEATVGEVNTNNVIVGTMFNRDYDEYYVSIFNKNNPEAILYSSVIATYTNKSDSLKVYFCDLDNYLNKDYYVEDESLVNKNAKVMKDLALGDFTFVKIKNGKIVKYLTTLNEVKNELGL